MFVNVILDTWTKCGNEGIKICWERPMGLTLKPFTCLFFHLGSTLKSIPSAAFFAAHWTAKGQTRCMLSEGGGSCHGRPGRYQSRISRLCLDDRTLPASPSLLSVHRHPPASVSWQPAQHDNRTTKGEEVSAVSFLNHTSWVANITICPLTTFSCENHVKITSKF